MLTKIIMIVGDERMLRGVWSDFWKSGARRVLMVLVAVGVFAGGALAASAGLASGAAGHVMRVRFGGDAERTRIVVDLERTARGQVQESGDRGRVVLALSGVSAGQGVSGRGQGLVRTYEVQGRGADARLWLELAAPAEIERRFLLPPGDGVNHYRYVIDLRTTEAAAAAPASRTTVAARAPQPAPVAPARAERRLIVIDAGHGGHDPGTQGGRINESTVTLQAARTLKAELERIGGYRVILTRDSDVYLTRSRRVAIAREAGAHLFISLHADSGPDQNTRGASVYTLSEQGAVRVVNQVTRRDGWHNDLRLPGRDPSVDRILLDMTLRATQNRSAQAARVMLGRIEASGHPMLNRSHRDAGFEVLLNPDVPALLLEMGFMTNPDDVQLLTDERGRRRLMRAVAEGIDGYFRDPGNGVTVAGVSGSGARR